MPGESFRNIEKRFMEVLKTLPQESRVAIEAYITQREYRAMLEKRFGILDENRNMYDEFQDNLRRGETRESLIRGG